MKTKILALGLMIWLIVAFGISILYSTEPPKVEWEYIKGGQGKAIVQDVTFDEVWERVQDVLFFEKFKIKGQVYAHTHEVLSIEKDSGLVSVLGYRGSSRVYTFKVMIQEKNGQVVVKTRCISAIWKKKVTIRFFQMLKEGLEGEKE